jgi:hypothetical protein
MLGVATVILLTVFTWVGLGLTIRPIVVADGSLWAVNRTPWLQGDALVGERVVVQQEAVSGDMAARLNLLMGGGEYFVATIVASPNTNPGPRRGTSRRGTPAPALPRGSDWSPADGTYLVKCEPESICGPPGTVRAVPVENVLGRAIFSVG